MVAPSALIYPRSLHDALPISISRSALASQTDLFRRNKERPMAFPDTLLAEFDHEMKTTRSLLERVPFDKGDRKSTRLNSSHRCISYAVFCLKKKIAAYLRAAK